MANIEKISDSELIELVKRKDTEAIKVLYYRFIKYLTSLCSRYIINYDDIKEVLQESFLKIITNSHQFGYRGEGSLKAWMSRIVINESLLFIKRKEKFEFIDTDTGIHDIEEEEPELEHISTDVIQELIRQLPTGYRMVFNLYVFEQKSHKEIAQILNIKENSSASQLHRAKEMLAKKIKEYNSTINAFL